MRKIPCPLPGFDQTVNGEEGGPPVYWLALPDVWLGEHAVAREEAVRQLREDLGDRPPTLAANWVQSLAVLEDWRLPYLQGHPKNWNVHEIPLAFSSWLINTVTRDYNQCFAIPKKKSAQLLSHLLPPIENAAPQDTDGGETP